MGDVRMTARRPMRRLADVLPEVAAEPGHRGRAAPVAPDGGVAQAGGGAAAGRGRRLGAALGPAAGAGRRAPPARSSRRSCGCAPAACSTPSRRCPIGVRLLELRILVDGRPERRPPCRLGRRMSSRLQLKYGLVAEHDRLSNSADAVVVSEPTTGSKARTKGSLYVIVTARAHDRRQAAMRARSSPTRSGASTTTTSRRASRSCLQKSIRSANRRLRQRARAAACRPAAWRLAVAVVRGRELYVATAGDAEAYLVRAARLLMPEHEPGAGPARRRQRPHRRLARRLLGRRLAAAVLEEPGRAWSGPRSSRTRS